MKIAVITLGCDKNRVDIEKLMARLESAGHVVTSDENAADVIVVNTCAFIKSAKQESIDCILNAAKLKGNNAKYLIVSGCLAQRYPDELKEQFPEVDAIMGVANYDDIYNVIDEIAKGERYVSVQKIDGFYADRVLSTPMHYAYLKIAEGCNNHCTYCAIPAIRGKYRSESIENLVRETERLVEGGVKELILVAQDVSRYGIDFDGKPHLIELVKELEKTDIERIRLLYLEPEMVTDELIEFVKNEPKVVKYMDCPLQHIDDGVLKTMNRHTTEKSILELVKKIKAAGITLRSTFICGFPGESEAAFKKLCDFISEGYIDYAGFFAYSREEGTPAYKLKGQVPEFVKRMRVKKLYALQEKVMKRAAESYIGKTVTVTYEDMNFERQAFEGRMDTQTPSVDTVVYFTGESVLEVGNRYDVKIDGVDGLDLIGHIENGNN